MRFLFLIATLLATTCLFGQSQVCPPNNDFSYGALTNWAAFVGFATKPDGDQGQQTSYSASQTVSPNTYGVGFINEYGLTVTGIQVISTSTTDYLGNFPTIPTINGYQYTNSVLLGSTQISRNNSRLGGYTRGVSYNISVPAGSTSVPYTMTYAYAMVLENGTHNSNQQPLFSATLTANGQVIQCASPKYYLPTRDNADTRGSGATLDTATALSQGFYLSAHPSPNPNPNSNDPNDYLRDVWAKGWTEVTFDLAPYRGQTVTLQFETDNCVPGGHFAYSYVAMRNICDGLTISGPKVACINTSMTYSVPALTGAAYTWTVPAGWVITSGKDSSVMQVTPGASGGTISVREVNSCADLSASLAVSTTPPTVAGYLDGGAEVCTGTNSTTLTLAGNYGGVVSWLASTNNGSTYTTLPVTSTSYTATDLTATTLYRALVQNGSSCAIDTSTATIVEVDPQTVAGSLSPDNMLFCLGQNKDALLELQDNVGSVNNWQYSSDAGVTWVNFSPQNTTTGYDVQGITTSTEFRVIVQSGVCPAEISSPATVTLVNVPFPVATYDPADTAICYGAKAVLNAAITTGTSYTWNNTNTLTGTGDGTVGALPSQLQVVASPLSTTNYVLTIMNEGCPNALKDTFHVHVYPPVVVDAGRDTSVVMNQPLQLHASASDGVSSGFGYAWTPTTDLNDPGIQDPIATLGADIDSIRYFVKATTEGGCSGTASILVKVFKTNPDIFVPNAFTPGGTSNFIFRPIPVGIATFQYFRVYNRYGQLVYATSQTGVGWDGRVNGQLQSTDTYVWMAQGISYMGKTVFRKGTVVLVR